MRTKTLLNRTAAPIDARVKKALHEKHFAEAVQLALDLPDRPELLYEAVQGRVAAWRASGQTVFAADLIRKVAQRLSGNPKRAQWLAGELAACGAVPEALMLAPEPGPVRAAACDASVERGQDGYSILPDELQSTHQAVIRAFTAFHDDNDDEARELLNQVGLASPFLDWKLLLRGLMAWHGGDDAKALENWQRLNMERLPAKLAAPLRASLDSVWLHQQKPEQQSKLRRRVDRLLSRPMVAELRSLQRIIETEAPSSAIRHAVAILAHLQAQRPDAVPRVVEALSLAVVTRGHANDVATVAKAMPPLREDPTFDALRALAAEQAEEYEASRTSWLTYEKVLAQNPEIFGAETPRARAMIWSHVAHLGRKQSTPRGLGRAKVAASKPTANQCETEALKLAPDLKVALFSALATAMKLGKIGPIIKAGERLLKHHRDDNTLTMLIDACELHQLYAEQFAYAKMLLERQPLDARVRDDAARAGRMAARARANVLDLEGARALADEARVIDTDVPERGEPLMVLLERAAGNEAAIELFMSKLDAESRGMAAVRLLAEANTFRCEKEPKRSLAPIINDALSSELRLPIVTKFVRAFADMHSEKLEYPGRKSHWAKVGRKLVDCARSGEGSPEDFDAALTAAYEADMLAAVIQAAIEVQRRFPSDPRFPFHIARARFDRATGTDDFWISSDLQLAEDLLHRLPLEQRPAGLAQEIAEIRHDHEAGLGGAAFREFFGSFADNMQEAFDL